MQRVSSEVSRVSSIVSTPYSGAICLQADNSGNTLMKILELYERKS